MSTEWSSRRRLVYGAGVFLAIILTSLYLLRDVVFLTPTCFDQKQNGFEVGIDCGGECLLRCSQEVIPLSVSWARAVPSSASSYDLVALVSNKNLDNAPREVSYTFTAYNTQGLEIGHATGTSVVPVAGDFPIIKQNISLPSQPSDVSVVISSDVPHYRVTESPTSPTLRVSDVRFESGSISRVYARITNEKRVLLRNIPVRAVLYDIDGNAIGAGVTLVPELGKEASTDIVFTWKSAFQVEPTKIRVYPILNPFSDNG